MSVAEVLRLHRAAHGAYLMLLEMGGVKDGPMHTRLHGPWRPDDREWPWVWGELGAVQRARPELTRRLVRRELAVRS